eukprot:g6983.t1
MRTSQISERERIKRRMLLHVLNNTFTMRVTSNQMQNGAAQRHRPTGPRPAQIRPELTWLPYSFVWGNSHNANILRRMEFLALCAKFIRPQPTTTQFCIPGILPFFVVENSFGRSVNSFLGLLRIFTVTDFWISRPREAIRKNPLNAFPNQANRWMNFCDETPLSDHCAQPQLGKKRPRFFGVGTAHVFYLGFFPYFHSLTPCANAVARDRTICL